MTDVTITIKDLFTGYYMTIPVLPETIPYTIGEKEADTVNIIGIGEVPFLRGKQLDTFTLNSFFPARYDPSYCSISEIKDPLEYRKLFTDWHEKGTKLQVIIPAAGINTMMTLRGFVPELAGAECDIKYSATFKQHITIQPKKIQLDATQAPSKDKTAADRPAAPAKEKPKTYTVKAGDTLTKIAKTYGIKDWRTGLFDKNKKVVGSNPDKIKPGQVLTL